MTEATITEIPLEQLRESPFNERKTFDQAALDSLAENIKSEGVIEPLLVRPVWANELRVALEPPSWYEIVVGHRRYRAGSIAGLATVPCMVQRMSEEEAKRKQVSENLQREKNVHALEEAAALESLRVDHGLSVADLVARTGKSESYVYGRLKLLTLAEPVRKAFAAGEIGGKIALLFARQEPALQEKALKKLEVSTFYRAKKGYTDGGKDGYRAVRDFLNEYFMFKLKDALWKLDDVELLPAAGACTTCPKRSGCTPSLFDDIIHGQSTGYHRSKGGENVCTDPDCFDDKRKAHLKRAQAELEAKGKTVIAGAKARQIVSAEGDVKGGYIEASKVRDLLKKAKATVEIATVQNPRDGKTQQVVKLQDLSDAGIRVKEAAAERDNTHRRHEADEKRRQEQAATQTAANRALFRTVRAAPSKTIGLAELRLIAQRLASDSLQADEGDFLIEVWNLRTDDGKPCSPYGYGVREALQQLLDNASPDELTQIILDTVLVEDVDVSYYNENTRPDALVAAAQRWGVPVGDYVSPPKKVRKAAGRKAAEAAPPPLLDGMAEEAGELEHDAALEAEA